MDSRSWIFFDIGTDIRSKYRIGASLVLTTHKLVTQSHFKNLNYPFNSLGFWDIIITVKIWFTKDRICVFAPTEGLRDIAACRLQRFPSRVKLRRLRSRAGVRNTTSVCKIKSSWPASLPCWPPWLSGMARSDAYCFSKCKPRYLILT